jgi:GNAT superfamily N-acetyltransferase
MRLKDEAGWNQTPQDWERFITASPLGCFAAEKDGSVVGTSTTIIYGGTLAWIGMVLVDSRHRGEGIGTELLDRAIAYLESMGVSAIKLDATPQGKPIYARRGFLEECSMERWILRRHAAGWKSTDPRASDDSGMLSPDVLSLDRETFGADRGPLLLSLAAEAPELVLLNRSDGALRGYALGRHGSSADHLGPWAASEPDIAEELLDGFLNRSTRDQVYVDRACANPWVPDLLRTRGFEPTRPLIRMYRGSRASSGRPGGLCAILGPEFG